jgi:DNA end-binding protein Ku
VEFAYGAPAKLERLSQAVLVSCAIALYPATSGSERVSFNQLNRKTGNRIYNEVDADTGDEVESPDIVKGYQVDKGVYVQVENEELEDLQVESSHTIEIDKFVPPRANRRAVL